MAQWLYSWVPTTWNSNFRGSIILFWPQGALDAHGAQTKTQAKPPHTNNKKKNLFLNTYRKKLLADLVELLQPPRGFSC